MKNTITLCAVVVALALTPKPERDRVLRESLVEWLKSREKRRKE
jgi:hypothetical protein